MHWFALGDGDLMLHPADRRVAASSVGLHAAVADVDALFRHISTEGLQPFDHQQPGIQIAAPVTREWGDREFELLDPDGYRWAFTQET